MIDTDGQRHPGLHEQLVLACSSEPINTGSLTGLTRAIARSFVDACTTGISEELDVYERTFDFCAGHIGHVLEKKPRDRQLRYALGRFDAFLDLLDMAYDRSISRKVIKHVADDPLQQRILQYLKENGEVRVSDLAEGISLQREELDQLLSSMESYDLVRRSGYLRRTLVTDGPKGSAVLKAVQQKEASL